MFGDAGSTPGLTAREGQEGCLTQTWLQGLSSPGQLWSSTERSQLCRADSTGTRGLCETLLLLTKAELKRTRE